MKNKYNARKAIVDGITFDSKREAARYKELKLLERCGKIDCLDLQPRFVLQESFKHDGKTIRKIEYVADFEYFDIAIRKWVVEDVKGMKTDVYRLKRKLFLARYGKDVEFREVR